MKAIKRDSADVKASWALNQKTVRAKQLRFRDRGYRLVYAWGRQLPSPGYAHVKTGVGVKLRKAPESESMAILGRKLRNRLGSKTSVGMGLDSKV
ncbi:hypothetical protein EVAR_45483_1 [Eumeta japonica]|uniref:Uncharacterized protein n=1 Tax=Eumeta variegata TaxID=151549 RepID=A0A4C1WHA8_EUMVA|nr:hypothetical protein EVAR_45483_1 [Eumeta japonica]